MKCEKCNSEKIQAISETVQTTEKDGMGLFAFLYFIYIIALFVAFGFFVAGLQKPASIPLDQIVEILTAIKIAKFTLPALFLTMLLKRIVPFKLETKTKIICLDCGNYWYIQGKEETNSEANEEILKKEEIEEEPIHERGSGLIRFIFVMVGLILVVALIYGFASSCPSSSKKTPPTIIRHGKTCDIDETIIGYYFSIKANDNYEDITIEYTFYTHSGDIFANNKLTKKDCKKGETYTLEVHLYQNQVSRIDFKNVLCQINSFS